MADSKLSALTELAAVPADNDLFAVDDVSDTTQAASGTTKKLQYSNLKAGITSGQVIADKVVAASGGDYTTVSAALAAAVDGWAIRVKRGTYTEGGVPNTTNLANISIIAEDPKNTILAFGANTFDNSFSGAAWHIEGLQFTFTTANMVFTGTDSMARNCIFKSTGTGTMQYSGQRQTFMGCFWDDQNTSTSSAHIIFSGTDQNIVGNEFKVNAIYSTANRGTVEISGSDSNLSDNHVYRSAGAQRFIALRADGINCTGNQINDASTTCTGIVVNSGGTGKCNVSNNTIRAAGTGISLNGSAAYYCTVSANTISDCTIAITSTGNFGAFIGNSIYGTGTGAGKGIEINGTKNNVSANTVTNTLTGIDILGGTRNNCVGNESYDNGANYSFAADRTSARNNRGADVTQEREVPLMKNTSGGTLGVGDLVVLKAVAAGNEFTTTTTAGDAAVLGVLEESTANNALGGVCTLGKVTTLKANGTADIAIGDELSCYTTAGIAQKAVTGDMVFARALEAYTTDDSLGVIDALLVKPYKK